MTNKYDLRALLSHINPASCSYEEWTEVGMALKQEGYTVEDWDAWSAIDSARYHAGECRKKWETFQGSDAPVTGGTIYQMAVSQGWQPDTEGEIDWDGTIQYDGADDLRVIRPEWTENQEIHEPETWNPAAQLSLYLDTLFEPGENVGYVVKSYKNKDGKYVPQDRGSWDRTAGQLVELLGKCGDDIGSVLGDYDPEGGAWIRFNPLDGKGVRNENVSDYRYALVESDEMELGKQNAMFRELELPIAVLMFSGGKSLHAIVRIDAADYTEYRKRVDYLYNVCQKNGIAIDSQNRNPSRLSRLPGAIRGNHKQFILDTNIGKGSWAEWREWIESVNDNLPDIEELRDVWDAMPELSPCLIDGVLRKGHKMLIAGPSKAGKSFLQIELAIAIAEGREWLGWQCEKGRVLYVNLEVDRNSCMNRFRAVYEAMRITPENLTNIGIWNLRGNAVPMDKLVPKLMRRAQKKNYCAIIIDPIYKVITGDENSAEAMAKFCNQFDRLCAELGCSVIYCHHHSKGAQGSKKAMDRASGSGVFARDPDAQLDMIELPVSKELLSQETNRATCTAVRDFLENRSMTAWDWKDFFSQDDWQNSGTLMEACRKYLNSWQYGMLKEAVAAKTEEVSSRTAWRIEGTLREFKSFRPVNVWFDYPIHHMDDTGALGDVDPEYEIPGWMKAKEARKEHANDQKEQKLNDFEIAFSNLENDEEEVSISDLADEIGVTEKSIRTWLGNSKRCNRELKKEWETYLGEDGTRLVRRKSGGGGRP